MMGVLQLEGGNYRLLIIQPVSKERGYVGTLFIFLTARPRSNMADWDNWTAAVSLQPIPRGELLSVSRPLWGGLLRGPESQARTEEELAVVFPSFCFVFTQNASAPVIQPCSLCSGGESGEFAAAASAAGAGGRVSWPPARLGGVVTR